MITEILRGMIENSCRSLRDNQNDGSAKRSLFVFNRCSDDKDPSEQDLHQLRLKYLHVNIVL